MLPAMMVVGNEDDNLGEINGSNKMGERAFFARLQHASPL